MIADKREFRRTLAIIRDGGGMSPDEFKTAIKAVGLTQEGAAIYFGKYKRLGQAWALGETDIPLPVQDCLRFLVANGMQADDM